jgi:DNA-binding transcriptional regulator YiaG
VRKNPRGFAGKIRALRKATGLSRAEFADRLGCSRVSVYRWEQGIVPPSKLALRMLAEFARGVAP